MIKVCYLGGCAWTETSHKVEPIIVKLYIELFHSYVTINFTVSLHVNGKLHMSIETQKNDLLRETRSS